MMNNQEYDELQQRLTNKLIKKNMLTDKEEEYNSGILTAKSIIADVYARDIIHIYRLAHQ